MRTAAAEVVGRLYPDASFAIAPRKQSAVFVEGPEAPLPLRYLGDPSAPASDETQDEIRQAACDLRSSGHGAPASAARPEQNDEAPLSRLNAYATTNWQVTSMSVEVTSRCNLRCVHCYLPTYSDRGLSLARLRRLATEAAEAGVVFVSLTGGEPFMRPGVMDVVELFASNFAVDIKTNGLRIDGGAIARLACLPLMDVQISVYDVQEGRSAVTRTPYPFRKVAEVAGALAAGGVPVTLSVLVTKHNIDHLAEIHRILSAIAGCTTFYSPYITPRRTGAGAEVQGRLSSREMRERLLPFLRDIDAVPQLRRYRCTESADTVCYTGRDQVAVLADGTVLPCLDMNVSLGNVQREPLAAVLGRRRERLSGFAMSQVSKCLRCSERDYCDSCPGIALAESGDWRIPVQHKCDVTQLYRAEGRR